VIDQVHGPEDGSGDAGPRGTGRRAGAPLPAVKDARWPRNAIDSFVLARLESERLAPSPEADSSRCCVRRRSTHRPAPTIPELDTFPADARPHLRARGRLRRRTTASMARRGLTCALRDTNGYEKDERRVAHSARLGDRRSTAICPDQFTVQQLAGDLLPDAMERAHATDSTATRCSTCEGETIRGVRAAAGSIA
jgi:hypothetical protein